jgi:heme-degrading monooxygenase HmoA
MSEPRSTPPATALVTRRVRRGRAAEFEHLMSGIQAVAAQFPGHMGGFLIPPEQAEQGCYRMLFAFDTEAHLQDWMQSQERQQWHQRIAGVTHAGNALMPRNLVRAARREHKAAAGALEDGHRHVDGHLPADAAHVPHDFALAGRLDSSTGGGDGVDRADHGRDDLGGHAESCALVRPLALSRVG